MVKCIQLHYTKVPNKQLIIIKITKSWDKNKIIDLEQVCRQEDHDFLSWLLSSKTIKPRLLLSSWSVICLVRSISQYWILKKKRLAHFERYKFVDIGNTFHNTNFTTLNGALSSYQTILACALYSELWSCVWMSNSSKTTFLHQRDLELWDNHDHPSFPPLYPLNWQISSIFPFFLETNSPFTSLRWEAHCNPKVHCSTQFRASFLYIKLLALWFVLFWRTKWVSLKIPINISNTPNSLLTFLPASSISSTMQRHTASKVDRIENGKQRVLRNGKRVFQSRGQANMNLVLAQLFNSSQDLCPYVLLLLQQHHVVLHVVWILQND